MRDSYIIWLLLWFFVKQGDEKMNILFLYDYPPKGTGLSVLGETFHKGLQELGHTITPHSLFDYSGIEHILQTKKFDLSLGIGYWNDSPREISLPKKFNVKSVLYWVSEGFIPKYQDIIPQADLLLATSEYSREIFVRDLPSMTEKIKVLYPGTDTNFFVPSQESPEKLFSTFDSGGGVKGCEEALQAVKIVTKDTTDFKYIIHIPNIEYPMEKQYYFKLRDLVKKYNLEKVVSLVAGVKFLKEKMPGLYQSMWFYLAPLRMACFGLPLIEAGACGVPTLAGNWKPMNEIIQDSQNGLLFNYAQKIAIKKDWEGVKFEEEWHFSDPQDMADSILTILYNKPHRNKMGQNARKVVEERFNYKKQSLLLEQVLEKIG